MQSVECSVDLFMPTSLKLDQHMSNLKNKQKHETFGIDYALDLDKILGIEQSRRNATLITEFKKPLLRHESISE